MESIYKVECIERKNYKRYIFTEEQKDTVVKLYQECKSAPKVGQAFGVGNHVIEKILKERKSYVASLAESGDVVPVTAAREEGITAQVIVPIVSGGDCLGAVAILSMEEGARIGANESNLARLTADILANQFE